VLHLMQPLAHASRLKFCIVPHAAISEDDCMCHLDYDDDDDGAAGMDEWMMAKGICQAHPPATGH
jgi:hypothetical protein